MASTDSPNALVKQIAVVLIIMTFGLVQVVQLSPFMIATSIEDHLKITANQMSLLNSSALIAAVVVMFFSPPLVNIFGVMVVGPVGGFIGCLGALLWAVGYVQKSYPLTLAGSVCTGIGVEGIVLPIANTALVKTSSSKQFPLFRAIANVTLALADVFCSYVIPLLPIDIVFWVALGTTISGTLCLIVALHLGKSEPSNTSNECQPSNASSNCCTSILFKLRKEYDPSRVRELPASFLLMSLVGVLQQSCMAFKKFSPYALERCHGVEQALANRIAGFANWTQLVIMFPTALTVDAWLPLQTVYAVSATFVLLASRSVAAVEWTTTLGWTEYGALGLALGTLDAVGACRARVLKNLGDADLLFSGTTYYKLLSRLCGLVTIQICYAIYTSSDHWEQLVITPGAFFMIGITGVMFGVSLLLACWYFPVQVIEKKTCVETTETHEPKDIAKAGSADEKTTTKVSL